MSNKSTIATIGQVGNVEKTENVSGKFFEIPAYQRLYAWESEQIETLLDDMKKACGDKKEQYFIGNITTSKKSENGREKFVLIDGQQRITTLWFIGFYLASLEYEWETKDKKYKKVWQEFILQDEKLRIAMPIRDNEEKAFKELAKKIKDNKGKYNLADSLPSNIHTKIRNAFECIEIWFNNAEKIQEKEVKEFAEFIYTKVCFVFVELAQNTDLNRFFVRMNNRGKQLEQHEILKARILHKISEKEREKYAEIWDLCSNMNKYIFQSKDSEIYEVESIIDFPTFLLHCYKLWVMRQENEKEPQVIQINRNKLLDMIEPDKKDNKWSNDKAKNFIESMLRYRVLFDGFVIKFTTKKGKETSEKESPYKIKRLSPDDNLVNSNLSDLEMIQNYLRVARRGENQNYEHWLTDFLRFLDSENDFSELKAFAIVANFYNKDKLNSPQCLIKQENESKETKQENKKKEIKLVEFLTKIDTEQVFKVNLKNEKTDKISVGFPTNYLSEGTRTPHYWFYRLEYYLWKWGKDNQTKLTEIENKFDTKIYNTKLGEGKDEIKLKDIFTKNLFHFRMLGSIEHFSAIQRESGRKDEWNLNIFGNLALISQNFNSSLSNQLEQFKKDEVINQLKRGRLESLKYFIMCANLNGDEWTENDAQAHQNQMIDILIESLKDSQGK